MPLRSPIQLSVFSGWSVSPTQFSLCLLRWGCCSSRPTDARPRARSCAWIAQTGRLDFPPLVLGAGVVSWVAGFDLIYATQDVDFDRREGLRSLVVRLGVAQSLRLAQWLHVLMFVALIAFGYVAKLGTIYYTAMPLIGVALLYEHRCARTLDLAGINRAFFRSEEHTSELQ